jgi:hypothetical protein
MKKLLRYHFMLICFLSVGVNFETFAANYYWRAVATDLLFTNINNWETSPGGGLSPAVAPGTGDDVYFPVASNKNTNINFNGGNCRDFHVTAGSPATFSFTGSLTCLGNFDLNGRATFNGVTINFMGAGSQTIQTGTSASIFLGGSAMYFKGLSTGTYTLLGPLNGAGYFGINFGDGSNPALGQGFNANGFDITGQYISTTGNSTKTLNFSNSRISLNYLVNGPACGVAFAAPSATTTYAMTGTRIIISQNIGTNILPYIQLLPNVQVSFDSLIFTATSPAFAYGANFDMRNNTQLTVNVLKLDVPRVSVGNPSDFGPDPNIYNITASQLIYAQPNIMHVYGVPTFSVGAITEAPGCAGQSAILYEGGTGATSLNFNTTAALTTGTIGFYGVNFGGSGLTTSTSNDLGLNSGSVTWGSAITGISYWWVGGTGNWNDPTKWSIIGSGGAPQLATGCLPSLQDNVFFDANSFTGSQTVTIPAGTDAYCKNIDWSAGSNQGLLASTATASNLMVNGNADFTKARGVNTPLVFIGSGSQTITSGGFFTYGSTSVRLRGLGTYSLTDNFVGNASNTAFLHQAGTFNTAGFTLDVAAFRSRSLPASAGNMRTLTITGSEVDIRYDQGSSAASYTIDVSFMSALNAVNSHIKLYTPVSPPALIITKTVVGAPSISSADLYNVSFMSSVKGVLRSYYTTSYNDVSFANSCDVQSNGSTNTVNNYNLTSGYTYSFQAGNTFNVTTGINVLSTPCADLPIIQSLSAGTKANIKKVTAPFTVNSAYVKDINATGATMVVSSGVDGGNNTNVTIGASTGRIMYWVGNAGNWSDGANHWSIGVSGGNPAITNPSGCVPRIIDSVVFDNNSFSLANQTVTLDIDGNCKGMMWTSAAGANTPIFAGASTRSLNNYGCLELGSGMAASTYNGAINMWGSGTGVNNNYIKMNGVVTNSNIVLLGGGRYDLLDSIHINYNNPSAFTIVLTKGNFITHGNKIYAGTMNLNVANGNSADISNSTFDLFGSTGNVVYSASHNATGGSTWNASGSTIITHLNQVSINNAIPITYGNLIYQSLTNSSVPTITGSTTNRITFKKVYWQNTIAGFVTTMNGVFTMDTLQFSPFNINTLVPGGSREYVVNDTLIAYGTPCNPTYIRSYTLGTPAIIKRTTCNTDLNFVNLRDITFGTCTAAQNKVIGNDEGGNSNVTITSIAGLTSLGNDTAILCKYTPLTIGATGFGNIPGMTYLWGDGETTQFINADSTNNYSILVTYAAGCTVSDSRTVTVNPLPPVALASGYEQVSPSSCLKNGYNYYEGASATHSFDTAILAINPNGNSISPTIVKVNNQGTLVDAVGGGTFSNTGTGYYQSTDLVNSIRVTKRLHTVMAPGTYTTNGGVKVRVYYTPADTMAMLTDAWPGAAAIAVSGWFIHEDYTAQEVVDSMQPGFLKGAIPITPIAYGTESGVRYAEFLVSSLGTFGFMAATTFVPLPIKLLSFGAQKISNDAAELRWTTGSEANAKQFDIMRSTDGKTWANIGIISAKGSNSQYSLIDQQPLPGNNFYRLQMQDIDGSVSYSQVRVLNFDASTVNSLTLYPNPAHGQVMLQFGVALAGNISIQIFNSLGQIVLNQEVALSGVTLNLSIDHLPKGVYTVRANNEGNSFTRLLAVE